MAEAIQFLREKIKVLSDEHGDNATQIEKFQAKNSVIDAQIRVLKEVLASAEQSNVILPANGVPVISPPIPVAKEVSSNGDKRLGPAESILRLLKDHPHGLTRKAIVAALSGTIQSTSGNQSRVLQNTIINLRNRGSVVVEDDYIKLT